MALPGELSSPVDPVNSTRPDSTLDFERFDALSFDCYGTLIDWEAGILASLTPLLETNGIVGQPEQELLERFGRLESQAERGPFRSYRAVLTDVARGFGRHFGFVPTRAELDAFAASVGDWPVFADTIAALRALHTRYRLAVVSNVDDDLFARSAQRIGVEFSEVVTAQQVSAYKPGPKHFHEVLERLRLPRDRLLHVAQSLYHDIAPARSLGINCVWVNRRAGKAGGGATKPSTSRPDYAVPDLRTLVEEMGLG